MNPTHIQKSNVDAFLKLPAVAQKLQALPKIDGEEYCQLHQGFLTPTTIVFDVDAFIEEVDQYNDCFVRWGEKHKDVPRYGLPLFNMDGRFSVSDPTMGSLLDWIKINPNNPIFESDCTSSTEAYDLQSLRPLKYFDGHYCRSSILKWGRGAMFTPHIDTALPSPWYRLWATTDPRINITYWDRSGIKHTCEALPGVVYLIDTSLVHEASWSCQGWVYQLFLALLPTATSKISHATAKGN
jgi:hypothetical protein